MTPQSASAEISACRAAFAAMQSETDRLKANISHIETNDGLRASYISLIHQFTKIRGKAFNLTTLEVREMTLAMRNQPASAILADIEKMLPTMLETIIGKIMSDFQIRRP